MMMRAFQKDQEDKIPGSLTTASVDGNRQFKPQKTRHAVELLASPTVRGDTCDHSEHLTELDVEVHIPI